MRNLRTTLATFGAVAVAAAALIPTSATASDDVAFANADFKACVNQALEQDAGAAISTAQAATVVDLVCTDGSFTDLSDVALLPGLKTLDISRGAAFDLSAIPDEGVRVVAEDMRVTLPAVEVGATQANPLRSPSGDPVIPAPVDPAAGVTVDARTGDWTFGLPVASSADAVLAWGVVGTTTTASSFSGTIVQGAEEVVEAPAAVAPPVVTVQPADQTVTEGDPASFTSDATSEEPVTVQWWASFDGGVTWGSLEDETDKTLGLDFAPLEYSGVLVRAEFTNSAGTVSSDSATLTVNPLTGPPVVLTHPQDLTVTEGETARFDAEATQGYEEFDAIWYLSADGGATWEVAPVEEIATPDDALTPFAVWDTSTWIEFTTTLADDGLMFKVEFINVDGSVETDAAMLTVLPAAAPAPSTSVDAVPSNDDKLASTGANGSVTLIAIAAGLIVAGGAAVVLVRRKRQAA